MLIRLLGTLILEVLGTMSCRLYKDFKPTCSSFKWLHLRHIPFDQTEIVTPSHFTPYNLTVFLVKFLSFSGVDGGHALTGFTSNPNPWSPSCSPFAPSLSCAAKVITLSACTSSSSILSWSNCRPWWGILMTIMSTLVLGDASSFSRVFQWRWHIVEHEFAPFVASSLGCSSITAMLVLWSASVDRNSECQMHRRLQLNEVDPWEFTKLSDTTDWQ